MLKLPNLVTIFCVSVKICHFWGHLLTRIWNVWWFEKFDSIELVPHMFLMVRICWAQYAMSKSYTILWKLNDLIKSIWSNTLQNKLAPLCFPFLNIVTKAFDDIFSPWWLSSSQILLMSVWSLEWFSYLAT